VTAGGRAKLKLAAVLLCLFGALIAPSVAAAGPTIITLTFDDGLADQYQARTMLAQDGLHATFFIISNKVGVTSPPSYMTWDQLTGLAADGNEIGGHTLDHVDLTTVTTAEATRQVCDNRQDLIAHGFNVTDFAYPYGSSNPTVESIVRGCGYSSARRAWGLCPIGQSPPNCPDGIGGQYSYTTSIPPPNIWGIRVTSVRAYNTLADMEATVTNAENSGGGWVPILMHHVCDGCDPTGGASVSPSILSAFLDWLAPRASASGYNGTYVRTMRDVISDHTAPTSSIACNGGSCSSWYAPPVSVTLSSADAGTAVTAIRYTTDGTDPTTSSPVYTGPIPISATTTVKYKAWDIAGNVEATKSQLIQVDPTPPSSSIACNSASCSSGWYGAGVSVSLSATDVGSGVAAIRYTTDGSDPTPSSTPYVGPFTVPATATVKYRAWDAAGNVEATKSQLIQIDTTAPSSSIACNGSACSAGWYGAGVSVSLSATDARSGVAAIRYTTDGSDPTSASTPYTGPFNVSSTTTVKYRAWDNVGNAEATHAQLIQIDTAPPSSSIACNGLACSSNPYGASVSVSLSATDAGSGAAAIRYTTDGSDPTSSSTLYNGPFTVSQTTTVKFRAWDNAGNVEATNTQVIQINTPPPDGDPPVSSIDCNGTTCSSGWYGSAVSVSLSATDSGSGVAAIRYTTDGSDPTSASPLYMIPITVSTSTTVKYRAWDNAGNIEATNTQLIQIDTSPPSSSIACNGSGCSSGWYTAAVSVSLSATDAQSGVAAIRYTTDGSDPTSSSTLYSGPFSVSATTTVKYQAWDTVGNAEATNSRLIAIDSTPPVSSIGCNGAACTSGWYPAPVSVFLQATDPDSGVAAIRYTLDGSNPTGTSTLYTGPFNLSATTTVKFRAWDAAGNVEATRTQVVQIDATAPTVAITSPANGATVTGNIKLTASASDSQSGVASVAYYVDGSLIGTATGSPWQVPWNARKVSSGQHVLTAVATDRVGNRQTSAPITVTVR
jgi:peptidoglycan/xylan/chitin deacetylase (PgdA/CDA1 family)/N-acetyl-beta-hexosaminidase